MEKGWRILFYYCLIATVVNILIVCFIKVDCLGLLNMFYAGFSLSMAFTTYITKLHKWKL